MKYVFVRGLPNGVAARFRCDEVTFDGNAMTMTQAQISGNATYGQSPEVIPTYVMVLPVGASVEIR